MTADSSYVHNVEPANGEPFGLLLLDKAAGLSSNRALQRVRRLFRASKAGHAGSLDPLATGMLPIFLGTATRLAGYLLDARKTYSVTAALGVATTTGDAEGTVTVDRTHEPAPAQATVEAALTRFAGEVSQVPPMYSALKRDGVPLYRLARAGIEVERAPRRVVIERLTLDRYEWPHLTMTVRCSKGTYVRTLVEDIAKAAGTVAHVTALRRLQVDPFTAAQMRPFEALESAAAEGSAALEALLLPADAALPGWPAVQLEAEAAVRLRQGQTVAAAGDLAASARVRVYDAVGRFLAIASVTSDGRVQPERVFGR